MIKRLIAIATLISFTSATAPPLFASSERLFNDKERYKLSQTGPAVYDYGARYYMPRLARFISADSTIPAAGDLRSFNRYSYCLNSPLVYTDPSGHGPEIPPALIVYVYLVASAPDTQYDILQLEIDFGTGDYAGAAIDVVCTLTPYVAAPTAKAGVRATKSVLQRVFRKAAREAVGYHFIPPWARTRLIRYLAEAMKDGLTGFLELSAYRRNVGSIRKEIQSSFAIDIANSGLRVVNNKINHEAGNRGIKLYAEVIREVTDEYGVIVFRERGDEFVISFVRECGGNTGDMRRKIIQSLEQGINDLYKRTPFLQSTSKMNEGKIPGLHYTDLFTDDNSAISAYNALCSIKELK